MPTPPGTVPTWATSGSIVTPSAGKQALGWVGVEHPEAEYLNWLFNLTGLWLTYVQATLNPGTRWRDCIAAGTLSNMTGPTPIMVSGTPWSSHGIMIHPTVGETISTIRLNEYYGGSVSKAGTLKLQRQDTTGAFTTLAQLSFNGDGGFGFPGHQLLTQALTNGNGPGGTTEIITDGYAYYFDIDGTGAGGGSLSVSSVGYQITNGF